MKNKKFFLMLLSVLVVASMVLVACGGQETEVPTEEPMDEEPMEEPMDEEEPMDDEPMVDAPFPVMPGGFLEKALAGEYSGMTVTVDGAFEGNDPDGVKMDRSVALFAELTGINVNYIGNKEFEATISVRVEAGDAPDIVDFPQPGKAASFVRDGAVVDVTSWMSEDWLSQQYNQSWRDMATIDGMEAGVFHRFNGKSLVWYPKDDWEAAGYEIPTTWDELIALNDLIASDGDTPWCIGIESGAATGWAATDWTEEMMLRTTSLENYDAWVAGTLAFDSPEVKNAIETWSAMWFNDDYVFGGRSSIVSTFFGDSPAPMFEDPPKCWMHKQGNFITGFFPEGSEAGVDYGFFYFPPVDEAYGKPFLVAGDMMVMFNDRPEVKALMEYFTVPESALGWLEGGGALAAHQTATPEMYGVDLERGIAELVSEATSFRFDGSDLMPGEVGAGSFWEQISSYVAGSIDLDTAMQEIDASWPEGVAGEAQEEPAEDEMMDYGFAVMPGGFLEKALAGEYSGMTVTVDGAFEGNDPDGVKMDRSVALFEELTGIDVNYIGNKEFEATISVRVEAGDAPDIVDFPQPGKAAGFVADGLVVDVTTWMSEEWLSQQYNQSWRDMVTFNGVEAGVFHRFNGKSLVWYPKDDWEAAGYEIPTTWDELIALNDLIVSDGDTPWCIGIESGAATGWAATDWTEEMMLRTTSLENYDAWVAGTLAFDSPEVKNAIETWSAMWFNDDYVFGGRSSIVSTFFGDSPAPMFEVPPKCWMHKQGNFITGFFPEGSEAGVDYGFFYLPPVDDAYGKPFLVAGDSMYMFNDRPEVKALMEYFTVPESALGWLEGGGALAAHQTATPEMYGVDLERGIAELVSEATSFRFDGSDLMPGEVGAGSFWEQISSYVAGSIDLDTAMQEIDASWPR